MSSDCSHLCPFASFSAVLGVKQITHLIFCFMLFTGSRSDNVYGIRSWLKSNVIGLCMLFVLGLYCNVLLFVGGSTGLAITCVLMLLLSMSGKIYFGLVVNSHHATLAPDHVWGSAMRVGDSAPRRTCRSVPPLHVQQPTAVLVAA
ncbi:Protein of unknown function [Gryllus bimaculatus]|nr:Protein of unknown function [Gryllus bimaculatus]